MSDLKTNLGAILATDFSEGDFGVKKNLAIGALAASAVLNPMKANASLPVRSDGMFYPSEDKPYPVGVFNRLTGERVTDPKEVYGLTKDFNYYKLYGAKGLEPGKKLSWKNTDKDNAEKRDLALKQTELDQKNKMWYGDAKGNYSSSIPMDSGGIEFRTDYYPTDRYDYKAFVDNKWYDVDKHGKPIGSRERVFSEQVDLLSGKARKANVKKEAQDLESLKRRIDLISDPSVRDALNKDWEGLNKDRVSRAWVRIPGKVGVASSLASVPATVATMAVAPAIALPLAAIQGAGFALSANQVRVANRAALRPAIDQLEEKVRKAEQDAIYAMMMANPASAQLPAKA